MIELKKLQVDRKRIIKIPVTNGNSEVEQIDLAIWHKPLTPALIEELDAIEASDRERLVCHLAAVLTRWDIVEDGAAIEPSIENLQRLEYETLTAMREAVFSPLYPKLTT